MTIFDILKYLLMAVAWIGFCVVYTIGKLVYYTLIGIGFILSGGFLLIVVLLILGAIFH